jgi:hypothetical protein
MRRTRPMERTTAHPGKACVLVLAFVGVLVSLSSAAHYGAETGEPRAAARSTAGIGELRRILDEQEERLRAQARALEEQSRQLRAQQAQLDALREILAAGDVAPEVATDMRAGRAADAGLPPSGRFRGQAVAVARGEGDRIRIARLPREEEEDEEDGGASETAPSAAPPAEVTPAPNSESETEVAALERDIYDASIVTDALGQNVLTPKGVLQLEPTIEYVHNSNNRFVFDGVEIVDAVLIGAIQASDTDRDVLTSSLGLRYGLTDRLEVDAKFPFVYRHDRINTQFAGDATEEPMEQSFDGTGLGDIEFGAHYQLTGEPPFLIANARVKTDTGTGPFEVDRSPDGLEEEAATGSGFWGFEPSLTAIFPSDPVVFFANVGYLVNFGRDVDAEIGDEFVGHIDPGDTVSGSLGMGFALNESASMSFGYEHEYIFETESDVTDADGNETTTTADSLQVGNLFLGGSYRLNDRLSLSSTVQVGVTQDSPDVQLTFRMPVRFGIGELF